MTTWPLCHVSACGHMTHVTLLISSRHYDRNSLAAIIINHQPLTDISPAVIITVTRQLIVFIEPEIKTSLKKASREGILPADCFIWAVKSPPDSIFWFRVRYLEAESPLGSGNLLHCRGQSHPSHENSSSAQPESLKHQAGYLTASICKWI